MGSGTLGTYAGHSRSPFATYLVCLVFSVTTLSTRLFSDRRFLSSVGTKDILHPFQGN